MNVGAILIPTRSKVKITWKMYNRFSRTSTSKVDPHVAAAPWLCTYLYFLRIIDAIESKESHVMSRSGNYTSKIEAVNIITEA